MLRALRQYVAEETAPRWKAIILSWETLISVAVLVCFITYGDRLFRTYPKISDVTTGLIAYASIALGFCVAGLTIALTLPEPRFTLRLAAPTTGRRTSAYSDLLFVFSWTAITHWFAVLMLFGVVLFSDGGAVLLPAGHSTARKWIVALMAFLCIYCLCQFLITLITLSQVGNLYVRFLLENHKAEEPRENRD